MKTIAAMIAAIVALGASQALAGSHAWVVQEVFSNADGTVQFIELKCPAGDDDEIQLTGKYVLSVAIGTQYDFTANLVPPSGDKSLLLATAAFAALPGAPTPDHILQDNFFDTNADEIKYFLYLGAPLVFSAGQLPLDGVMSLDRDGNQFVNSPTNYMGQTGSIDASVGPVPAASTWGMIVLGILVVVCGGVVLRRRPAVV